MRPFFRHISLLGQLRDINMTNFQNLSYFSLPLKSLKNQKVRWDLRGIPILLCNSDARQQNISVSIYLFVLCLGSTTPMTNSSTAMSRFDNLHDKQRHYNVTMVKVCVLWVQIIYYHLLPKPKTNRNNHGGCLKNTFHQFQQVTWFIRC